MPFAERVAMSKQFMFSVGVASLIAGCVEAEQPDEDSVASEISVAGGATWSGTTDLPLGPTASQTCFLTGVSGQFSGLAFDNPHHGFKPSLVSVRPKNGTWVIHNEIGLGSGVQARVMCVNIPYNPNLEMSWSDDIPGSQLPDAPHRHCMLREVWSTGGLDGLKPFANNPMRTNISVQSDGTTWTMDNSYVDIDPDLGQWGFGGGTAVCFDYHGTFALGQSFNGPPFGALPFLIGSGLPVSNTACGLAKVEGSFLTAPLGLVDGAVMDNDPADSPNWMITIAANKTARVHCSQ